jgi:hypothetical protein
LKGKEMRKLPWSSKYNRDMCKLNDATKI